MDTALMSELQAAHQNYAEAQRKLEELRQKAFQHEVDDYTFQSTDGEVRLSELFGDQRDLIMIHNMGRSCPYCTLWADGFIGLHSHLQNRAAFAIASPDDPKTQRAFAQSRSWPFRMVSTQGTTFAADMGYELDGSPQPGVSSFYKEDSGRIRRVSSAPFGPGDEFCSVWHFFDLLEDGANGWEPKHNY